MTAEELAGWAMVQDTMEFTEKGGVHCLYIGGDHICDFPSQLAGDKLNAFLTLLFTLAGTGVNTQVYELTSTDVGEA